MLVAILLRMDFAGLRGCVVVAEMMHVCLSTQCASE